MWPDSCQAGLESQAQDGNKASPRQPKAAAERTAAGIDGQGGNQTSDTRIFRSSHGCPRRSQVQGPAWFICGRRSVSRWAEAVPMRNRATCVGGLVGSQGQPPLPPFKRCVGCSLLGAGYPPSPFRRIGLAGKKCRKRWRRVLAESPIPSLGQRLIGSSPRAKRITHTPRAKERPAN
jgi:hypothetical protein